MLFLICKGIVINGREVAQVKGTLVVDALVKGEETSVLLGNEGMTAIRALEFQWFGDLLAGNKGLTADFALELAIAAVVVVKIVVRGSATRTSRIFGD